MTATRTVIAEESDALRWAGEYIAWCRRHAFLSGDLAAKELLDPDNYDNPALSPFFQPHYYLTMEGMDPRLKTNAYRHYFTQGWTARRPFSPLVEMLFLRQTGFQENSRQPMLVDVLQGLDENDLFSTHPLFDASVYRLFQPKRNAPAMVEFVREPVNCLFSPYVDLDMLDDATYDVNTRTENALCAYLHKPVGTDINPAFFSLWYHIEYKQRDDVGPPVRDMLSDYLLLGVFKGWFPNPYARRDAAANIGLTGALSPQDMRQLVDVPKNIRDIRNRRCGIDAQ
jgi:hypothetical protein